MFLRFRLRRTKLTTRFAPGSALSRPGQLSRIPLGSSRLPGLMAATAQRATPDRLGNPFAVISPRRCGEFTVIIEPLAAVQGGTR
ncbi:hypothetical protein C1M55_31425 (plasmid) [Rhodococcus qingshengii]|jgi:hypothetical protein|uniref:hypothetical protein n=1 Tax=Rhodococcus qingshengii TaxID=334542 RepID=UPI000C9FCDE4|nr:hypothetical protein [Rhodococcus qingshengii]AUS35769.1 hypothetical protein C1M55_31425 [Rhodococcus qingshengii]